MTGRIKSEIKIVGIHFFVVSAALTGGLILLANAAGELLDFYPVCFEVLFPFFVAMAVGEWGKTRADHNFDIIAAQSSSLFLWVLLRYAVIFGLSSVFAIFAMVCSSAFRYEFPLWELLVMCFPVTFFLSSLCALLGICCTGEHMAAMACGMVWLIVLFLRSLLRIPGAEYVYLFIRYAGIQGPAWLWNKGLVTGMGLLLWGILFLRCRRNV